MSNAEHLLENTIYAMKHNQNLDEVLSRWPNNEMLKQTSINKDDLIRMASHVVYSLYDGRYPLFGDDIGGD